MSLLFSELIHTQQEVKLFGPAFSSPAIWSVIFQVLHFHYLSRGILFTGLVAESQLLNAYGVSSAIAAYF